MKLDNQFITNPFPSQQEGINKYVYTESKHHILLQEEIGKGGEGSVFLVNNDSVAKIYRPNHLTKEKRSKILAIIQKEIKIGGVCLPQKALYDDNEKFIGYLMPKADAGKGFEMQTCIFNPKLLENKFPAWTRVNLVNLSLSILEKIQLLHKQNIIIGDINPFNILVKNDNEVYFVDTDSYQVDNYPCPVGTVHFTAPELQNINSYSEVLRTREHEYFAVATLLFMIFHPGKSPYAFQGGGDIKENIISMNFSYPLGDEDNYMAPQGMWEYIWSELSYELRRAFYDVFKEDKRLNIVQWIAVLKNYKDDLLTGSYSVDILPKSTEKILVGRTVNMNRKDIKDSDVNLRNGKTLLRPNAIGENIGVLELSTKAVKFLTAEQDNVKEIGFKFDYFFREARKTETGQGLDENNYMDMNYFNTSVMPSIKQMLRFATERRVDVLYSVATAAYRTANNRDEIISTIREQCGINVKILSKKEEAIATLMAFTFSKSNNLNLDFSEKILMIDQGGGSTEMSLFQGGQLLDSYSLNLGTTVLKTVLFREANKETLLAKALKDSEKFVKERLNTYYSSKRSSLMNKIQSKICISVGTAITKATNKKGNAKQHGTRLTLDMIIHRIQECDKFLSERYTYVSELSKDVNGSNRTPFHDALDSIIVMRLGLPMYVEIMKNFDLDEIVVSGTGLWYGIYFENIYNINS